MRAAGVRILLGGMLLLAACGSTDAPPASQVASRVASPTPAMTTPQPTVRTETPANWERIEIEEHGFSMALPRGWEVADLTRGDIDEMLAVLGDDPQFQAIADQLPDLMASGIGLFAVSLDADALDSGFATNMNVYVEENAPLSLDVYAAANISFLEDQFDVDVARETVNLPSGDSARMEYEPSVQGVGTYHVTQYIVVADEVALIATFSRATGPRFDALETEFRDIMDTLTFAP